jgi:legumain
LGIKKKSQKGVRIDYKRDDVTTANFMAVLLGNETATNGKPVLKSTKNDKVFVYYTDHGSSGVVSFPAGWDNVVRLKKTIVDNYVDGCSIYS